MLNFQFYSPTCFVFGKDTEAQTGELVKRFGGHKVLLHYGGGSVIRSGLLDRVKNSLMTAGIEYVELGGAQPNPRSDLVYEGIELVRKEGCDFILPVGGGSTIDSAKAIACGAVYDGDFWNFFAKKDTVKKALPIGTVLTIPAAGSEGSDSMVITNTNGMIKRGHSTDFVRPVFSVMNPELTYTLPAFQTVCGVADMMAHIFERYFTRTENVMITDEICEGVLRTIIQDAPKLLENPCDYDARASIMWCGMLAHNNTCGVGREQDWGTHAIEHELSALYDVAHGAGLAVMFPAWMKFVYKTDIPRFAKIATRVWGIKEDPENPEAVALAGIEAVKKFWHDLGLPTSFEELGAKEEDIPLLASKISYVNGTLGKFVKMTREDIEAIYRLAL